MKFVFFCRTLGLALLLLPTLLFSAPARILLIGDSITNGGNGFVGYRYPLYYELKGAGYDFDFVGNNSTLYQASTPNASLYPDYNTTFDKDHDGYWGITSTDYANSKSVAAAALVPDIVTIHLGTNDIQDNANYAGNYQASMDNLGLIIDRLRAANPNVKIAVAQIIPPSPASASWGPYYSRFAVYNTAIASFSASKSTAQSPIQVVDQYTGFDGTAMTQSDNLHPNQYGAQLMADRFYIAVQQLVSPGQPIRSPDVHLGNASFDDSLLTDGSNSGAPAHVGWTFNKTASITDAGIVNTLATSYLGAAGNGAPQGGSGPQFGYVYNNVATTTEGLSSISQVLGAILTLDTYYDLTIAIGNRLPDNPYHTTYGGYRIELYAGSTLIGFEENAFTPAAGTFGDASFSIFANDLDPSLLGESLKVSMSQTSVAAKAATDFDNVRLTASVVPEPSSMVLATVGLGMIIVACGMRRRFARLVKGGKIHIRAKI